jgi:hypothetical protein
VCLFIRWSYAVRYETPKCASKMLGSLLGFQVLRIHDRNEAPLGFLEGVCVRSDIYHCFLHFLWYTAISLQYEDILIVVRSVRLLLPRSIFNPRIQSRDLDVCASNRDERHGHCFFSHPSMFVRQETPLPLLSDSLTF